MSTNPSNFLKLLASERCRNGMIIKIYVTCVRVFKVLRYGFMLGTYIRDWHQKFVKDLRQRVLSDIYIRDLFQRFISAIYVRYISCQRFMLETISKITSPVSVFSRQLYSKRYYDTVDVILKSFYFRHGVNVCVWLPHWYYFSACSHMM